VDAHFGIHQRSRTKVGHVVELSIWNPQVLVMMQLIKNVTYCIQDALQGLSQHKEDESKEDKEKEKEESSDSGSSPAKDSPKMDALSFAVRLRLNAARVLVPVASSSKRALGLDCREMLIGFPGNALTPSEVPQYVCSAATLLRDCEAVRHCNLRGRAGQLRRRESPSEFQPDMCLQVGRLRVYNAQLSYTAAQERATPQLQHMKLTTRLRNLMTTAAQVGVITLNNETDIIHELRASVATRPSVPSACLSDICPCTHHSNFVIFMD
jgi:hypothetical protein